ncbi:MAG: CRISPR-associated protein Cas4 [Dehalococcoidia bacterium]|nr:CRISPR-associated protein Cas4 [Dehalococcoidia bacterium]
MSPHLDALEDGTTFDLLNADDRVDVPISAIEHFSYCPRQCALIHVEQTYEENQFTIRGRIAHERVDSGEQRSTRGVREVRALSLWSDRYGLVGKADLVEFRDGRPFPVEYKVGRRRGVHAALQLCAQAICLEEMFGGSVEAGALYFRAERQRYHVPIDAPLRQQTLEIVEAVRQQVARRTVPEAPNDQRCRHCSLINACLPSLVASSSRLRRAQRDLFRPQPLAPPSDRKASGGA